MTRNERRKIKRRETTRMKNIEVLLNQKNDYDFPDPTAYLAVKNIVNTNLRKEME